MPDEDLVKESWDRLYAEMAAFDSLPLIARRALNHVGTASALGYLRVVQILLDNGVPADRVHAEASAFVMQGFDPVAEVRIT